LADRQPAIDDDDLSGDVGSGGRKEKDGGAGTVFGRSQTPEQNLLFVVLFLRRAMDRSGEWGMDEAGGDGVNANRVGRERLCEGAVIMTKAPFEVS
jgi:hypothetical protein